MCRVKQTETITNKTPQPKSQIPSIKNSPGKARKTSQEKNWKCFTLMKKKGTLFWTLLTEKENPQEAISCHYRYWITQNYSYESPCGGNLRQNYKLQHLRENKKFINYISNKNEFLGAIIEQVESGMRKLDEVTALVAETSAQTELGRDWLSGLGMKVKTEGGKKEIICVNEPPNKLFTECKDVFSRDGFVEVHEIITRIEKNCMPKQQKGPVIPLQLQNAVKKELEKQ